MSPNKSFKKRQISPIPFDISDDVNKNHGLNIDFTAPNPKKDHDSISVMEDDFNE